MSSHVFIRVIVYHIILRLNMEDYTQKHNYSGINSCALSRYHASLARTAGVDSELFNCVSSRVFISFSFSFSLLEWYA